MAAELEVVAAESIEFLKQNNFETMAKRRVYLQSVREQTEAEIKKLNLEIEALFLAVEIKSVEVEGHYITRKVGTSASRLSKERLLENGVSGEVIAKSTVPGTPWSTIEIRKVARG